VRVSKGGQRQGRLPTTARGLPRAIDASLRDAPQGEVVWFVGRRSKAPPSVAHEPFELPRRPVHRLLDRLALVTAHRHLGLQRLCGAGAPAIDRIWWL
jgi:hypothetical protein